MVLARLGGALTALLLVAGPAAGQDLSRADPMLRHLLRTRPAPAAAPIGPRVAADRVGVPSPHPNAALVRAADGVRVRVLVRVDAGGEAALRRAGAAIGARAGDIVTARVPLDAVLSLLAEPGVRAMEAATPLRMLGAPSVAPAGPAPGSSSGALDVDSASADARFDDLRWRVGSSWKGLVGQGVIIGVFDSGLDLAHDDFLDGAGNTRVLFAWDQTDSTGAPPGAVGTHTLGYGTECTATMIDEGACPMVDNIGHGTHVTGTAAGDGSATGQGRPAWRFPGGAPAADLIVVKGGEGSSTPDLLLEGVAYIFARARELGRPAVVNLSLSGLWGPHDGSTVLERGLNALTGPGRIIVAGAGNDGDHRNTFPPVPNGPKHAQGVGTGSHGVRIPPFTPRPSELDGTVLELWYDGRDSLSITVTSPRGDSVTAATGDTASLETAGGAMAIDNALGGPDPRNGDHGVLIGIGETPGGVVPDTGVWQVDVTADAVHGSGVYHLWVAGTALVTSQFVSLSGGTTNRYLVGVPATGDRIISVGAHVTRQQWEGVGGDIEAWPALEEMGDIAFFSSPGPRRDGARAVDLTAPGKTVISSLARGAWLWDVDANRFLIEADSVHVGLLGTSVSAPVVTAAVALLLQVDPELTPEEARDALQLSARTDPLVATPVPNPVWGSGKLDATGATERLAPDGLAGAAEPVNLSENPVRGDELVINYAERPTSVAVYTLVAERVRTFSDQELGPFNVVWPLDTDAGGDVANGAYVLVVELPDRRVVRKIFVARR